MSRRASHYLTPAQNVPMPGSMSIPRAYFLQDDADFSDGEADTQYAWPEGPSHGPGTSAQMHENMSQGPPPDITELYRRKTDDHYVVSQEVVMSDEPRYYYRPAALARIPQRRLPVSVTPSSHGGGAGVPMPHPGAYFTPPHEEPRIQYEGVMYRSSPHLHQMIENSTGRVIRRPQQLASDQNPQGPNLVRTIRPGTSSKPAVSVPTPRFYRRASVYKRPSTLCLQLPSTPDPARPIKTRLPSTMPGLSIPPLSLRSPHAPHFQSQQQMTGGLIAGRGHFPGLERARTNIMIGGENDMEERFRGRGGIRRQLTARSAPPRCEERAKEEEELERVQRMIMEQRGMHHEFGDESASNAGETDPKCSELELLLNQYEQIFSSGPEASPGVSKPAGSRRSSQRSRAKRKASSGRIAGLMRPRLPPSLKNQKRTSSKSSVKHHTSSSAEEDRLEIEQMTAEVLDNLLQDLSVGGLAGDAQQPSRVSRPSSEIRKSESKTGCKSLSRESKVGSRSGSRSGSRAMSARGKMEKSSPKDLEEKPSSKNLTSKKSEHFTFTAEAKPPFDDIPTKTTFMQDKEKFSKFSNSSHTSFEQDKSNPERHSRAQTPYVLDDNKDNLQAFKKDVVEAPGNKDSKKTSWSSSKRQAKNDDHAALELHRSKSYIVNLIDRALSRELGTIPEERSSKQYLNMDARTAMDLITSKNMDTDMCLEITQAIADSLSSVQQKDPTSNTLNPPASSSTKAPDSARGEPSKTEGELMFSTGTEEPLYIKQLKKLRWGHLKHIQREMRRLEDLERFLDSCSSDK